MHTANGNTRASENILVFDVGSTFTKASAFACSGNELTWLGRAQAPTTVEDIEIGLANATAAIAASIGRESLQADKTYAASSAAGGAKAAKKAGVVSS